MVNKTYRNFVLTMDILMNQARMTKEEAERKTRQIFDAVEYDRKVRGVKSIVENYLVAEINLAREAGNV